MIKKGYNGSRRNLLVASIIRQPSLLRLFFFYLLANPTQPDPYR